MDRSRVTILAILFLLPMAGLEARLVQIQWVDPPVSQNDIIGRRRSIQLEAAHRGRILDVRGRVLAEDRRTFDVYLVLEEHEKSPAALPAILGMAPAEFQEQVENIYKKIESQMDKRPTSERRKIYLRERRTPYLLKRDVPFETAVALETAPQRYPGTVVRESLKRHYPLGPVACHEVGYMSRVTANQSQFDSLLQNGYFTEGLEDLVGEDGVAQLYRRGEFHDDLIGRSGLELCYDDELRARPGLAVLEREPGTSRKTTTVLRPPQPGHDVELTLDATLQAEVEGLLADTRHISAVVMDPATGAVLALASNRLYDPNDFIPPGDSAGIQRTLSDSTGKPLISRAFSQHYQLGSVFKVVSAVGALEDGKVSPDELLPCRGRFFEKSKHFACWIWNERGGAHGEVALHEALARSCNCYFYELGRRLGMERLAEWAVKLGYGDRTGIDLPGEAAGILPRVSRQENDVLSLVIGQHELMASPLQAAVMMSVIANGGFKVTPHLKRNLAAPPEPLGISASTLEAVRNGLREVVHASYGTAHATQLRDTNACGKTSSAQTGGGRNSHAWFAGYAPEDKPRFVVVVFVELGGHGGDTAAPIVHRILAAASKLP